MQLSGMTQAVLAPPGVKPTSPAAHRRALPAATAAPTVSSERTCLLPTSSARRAQALTRRGAFPLAYCRNSSFVVHAAGQEEYMLNSLTNPRNFQARYTETVDFQALPIPGSTMEGRADDANLHNPLQRLERLGCGYMGVVFDLEGVVAPDTNALHAKAWQVLAQEEGKPPPPLFMLKKAMGMKSVQVVSEVLCWAREPGMVRQLAARKEELFMKFYMEAKDTATKPANSADATEARIARAERQENLQSLRVFLRALEGAGVPRALISSSPQLVVDQLLDDLEAEDEISQVTPLRDMFDAIVVGEDMARGKPDPEGYFYASQLLGRIPARCVVIGSSNSSIEAAQDCGMHCVGVASQQPLYELGEAQMVVRNIGDISVTNLKNLFAEEQGREPEPEPELEPDPELDIDMM
mmetsp:Transcript_4819/g.17337  ORF Transcript_4819/g.17337 Transcript_4819/m.17337 type:complete len:410 (+) Transcript_4819:189-1418(+)